MKNLNEMSKEERSLLLFLETQAVDNDGAVKTQCMNTADFNIAYRWHDEGFIQFGRIASADIMFERTHWCELSDEAWILAAQERKARALRSLSKRRYNRTNEL